MAAIRLPSSSAMLTNRSASKSTLNSNSPTNRSRFAVRSSVSRFRQHRPLLISSRGPCGLPHSVRPGGAPVAWAERGQDAMEHRGHLELPCQRGRAAPPVQPLDPGYQMTHNLTIARDVRNDTPLLAKPAHPSPDRRTAASGLRTVGGRRPWKRCTEGEKRVNDDGTSDQAPLVRDVPAFFKEQPSRPMNEREIRIAVDALWRSLQHPAQVDERAWKGGAPCVPRG